MEKVVKPIGRPPGTHCKNGHLYTPENTTFIRSGPDKGQRNCTICRKAAKARAREKAQKKNQQRKESWFF